MPSDNAKKRNLDEITRLGDEILHRKVEPLLISADAGKFVAIDLDSEDFEVHKDDMTAMKQLIARHPKEIVGLAARSNSKHTRCARLVTRR